MKRFTRFLPALAALALASACQTMDTRVQKLRLGMTKQQTTALLGKGFHVVGARESSDARKIEVIRYDDTKSGELLLYFRDGQLVQWGDTRVLDNMP